MVIKFNKSEAFNKAKAKLTDTLTSAESTEQEQATAFENFFDAMQTDVINTVRNQVNDEMLDRSILQQRGQNVLTAKRNKIL